jgi:hypothetical protein
VARFGAELERAVRNEAKTICEKYVSPPQTTDFAILFLPTEGLYAEVMRRPGLADDLQRTLRVTIAGPSTLTALLNSLQMGFRTLALEKRSSEVWQVLGAVKTEFGKFGDVLAATKTDAGAGRQEHRERRGAQPADGAQAEVGGGAAERGGAADAGVVLVILSQTAMASSSVRLGLVAPDSVVGDAGLHADVRIRFQIVQRYAPEIHAEIME